MHKGKRNAIVKALTKAGWGDAVRTDWECDGDLIIIAEQDFGKGLAGDYYRFGGDYDDFGVHNEINEIVQKYGCFTEWVHCGAFAVCRG